ncbi:MULTISPECIES: hypothetical protein [Thermomonospora]|uniref:Protein kinase domain-containing protein n=1 Tax=Thermomonospora cellulosilytica TaxID=1411118 RepID=A0A7W3MV61_9ACTN|nr:MULTISPECIES: hypothetical protein [Thermomonospora]MBA9002501.1 hypothetical protein [Thermomonospora cellulosilytica]
MTWLDGSDVQVRDLRVGAKLGQGGQGAVHELQGLQSGYVYKEYLAANVNGDALTRLVNVPRTMAAHERDLLLGQSAWPLARVVDGAKVRGFVMRKVPPGFWGRRANKPALRELQYLLYEPKKLWGDIVPLDAPGRLEVARKAAELFFLLHSRHLVVGDVSMRNLLWSPPPVSIYLLDCDAIRVVGERPVMPQPQTPDWNDPHQPPTGPELDTDRYKLALLVARVLSVRAELRPGEPVPFVDGLPGRVVKEVAARFAEAARGPGLRPDAAQWIKALSDRGTIDLPPLPPVRKPPDLPKAPLDVRPVQRPVIRLRPPGQG